MIADEYRRKQASLLLTALSASKVMGDVLEGARLERGTPIYDINGEVLFERLGLKEHLTPQRSNGFRSMVERIKSDARNALATSTVS